MMYFVARVSWVGSVLHADPARPLTTAAEELDDLDHDLSDVSVRGDLDHDISDLSEVI